MTPAERQSLLGHPLLAGYTPQERQGLVQAAEVVELARWERREVRDHLLVVLRGRGWGGTGDVARELRAGDPICDVQLLDGFHNFGFAFTAREPTRVALLPMTEAPAHLMHALAREFERWLGPLDEELAAQSAALESFIRPDGRLTPPPYHFEAAELLVLVVDPGPPLIERGLRELPVPGGAGSLLVLADFPRVTTDRPEDGATAYREASLFRPCFRRARPGLHVEFIHPEHALATLIGREVFGLPKRVGTIRWRPHEVHLDRRDRQLELRWGGEEELPAGTWMDALGEAVLGRRLPFGRLGDGLLQVLPVQALVGGREVPLFSRRQVLDEGPPRTEGVVTRMRVERVRRMARLLGPRLHSTGPDLGRGLRAAFRVVLDCSLVGKR